MIPSMGRIVIYRNAAGVDSPAIITEVTPSPDDGQPLVTGMFIFWGPNVLQDPLPSGGFVPGGDPIPQPSSWRWPERVE